MKSDRTSVHISAYGEHWKGRTVLCGLAEIDAQRLNNFTDFHRQPWQRYCGYCLKVAKFNEWNLDHNYVNQLLKKQFPEHK